MILEAVMKKRKVLLMYITEVSGHHQATLAIEKSLKLLNPTLEILNINGFSFVYPIMEKVINKAYMGVIKRTPRLWDYLYDNPKVVERTRLIKERIHKANHAKFQKLFEQFQPDVIACTQAFPCGLVADYKVTYNLDFRLIGVLTDYAPHSYWIHEGVDHYVVPCEEVKQRLVDKGVAPERVKSLGIPIDPKFSVAHDKQKIIEKLGIDAHLPVILVMGGGHGIGPIRDIVKSLDKLAADFQMIILAGKNKRLIKWLQRKSRQFNKRMIVHEFADNVEEFMEVASLAITKPGGITTAEALVKGLPMVIVRPIPGQEMYNTQFLLDQGVAVKVGRLNDIGPRVDVLLKDSKRLKHMEEIARAHGKPNAALDIAKLILQ